MPLLVFTVEEIKESLFSGEMLQTVRHEENIPYWQDLWRKIQVARASNKKELLLHIWWKHPRRNRNARRLGAARFTEFLIITGAELTDDIARRDGFNDKMELIDKLALIYQTDHAIILGMQWAIIRYQWVDGPRRPDNE